VSIHVPFSTGPHSYLYSCHLVNSILDTANIRLTTDESPTIDKTRKTPRPQKSSAKAKAAVDKMKGAATTAPCPPDESDESDEPDKAEVEVETDTVVWDHPESEQKNKADEISVDDGDVTGIQSVMEAASAVVSLPGVATTITSLTNGPKKSK
jgi:hypothetical protein